AFFAIPPARRESRGGADARAGHASRGGNHAGFLARIDFEKWPRAGGGRKVGHAEQQTALGGIWGTNGIDDAKRPLRPRDQNNIARSYLTPLPRGGLTNDFQPGL